MQLFPQRRARALIQCFTLTGVAVLVSTTIATSAYASGVSTSSVLKSAKTSISKERGAHVVFVAASGSSNTEKIVADVGTKSGIETISESNAHLVIKVTPADGYVSGNSSGLTSIFGMTSAEAKKLGNRWVVWKAGTSAYSNLKSDVTISSVTDLLPKAKGTKLSTKSTNGSKRYVLKWTSAATSSVPKLANTLVLSARGATVALQEIATATGGTKVTTTFSKWGEHVVVNAPAAGSTLSSSQISG